MPNSRPSPGATTTPSALARLRARAELELRRRRQRETFRQFVDRVRPGYRWYRHCVALADVLQRVADGELKRVMVFMPPRHGKSELASRLFPAYFLGRHPDRWVGLNCYGQELANTLSRAARDFYERGGGSVRDDASAVKHWQTPRGGGLWAAGVGGPITGKGWHLGVIDDPLKNAADAASETIRAGQEEWYTSTFYTREEPDPVTDEPDGALVIIQTRWHEDDLSGRRLAEERAVAEALAARAADPDADDGAEEEDEPERWHIVSFEAIKDEAPFEVPATCTLEPDWRSPGEALCPERRPLKKLKKIAARIGAYFWNALFQQRPRPRSGTFLKAEWFPIVDAAPADASVRWVRAWDHAATEGAGDWTVGLKMAVHNGIFFIVDVVRFRKGPGGRDAAMRSTAERDGPAVRQVGEKAGNGGPDWAVQFLRLMAGFPCELRVSSIAKIARADPFASQAEAGNVRLVRGPWNAAFLDECTAFPVGANDDQVDAGSLALAALTTGRSRDPQVVSF